MAYSFTEEEKRFILAESIKNSSLDVSLLVGFLKTHNVEPDWLKMQLPSGRTMGQCLAVTEHMFQGPMRIPDLKRKSMNDLLEQPPKRLAAASPMEPPAQLPPLASATQGLASYSSSMSASSLLPAPPQLHNQQLANIQPRPAGMGNVGRAKGSRSPGQQQQPSLPPRKRGRPSRADKARQLRPLLPQRLTPLAPAPRPIARESPTTPGEFSMYKLSPGAASEAANEPTRRKRGRPKSFGRTQLGTFTDDHPKTDSGRSTPSESSRQQSDEIPQDPYNEDEQVSDSQKDKAIPHIGHLQQEELAR
ncbi:hypothetical protein CORC01_04573 [Colletotrichum orchidophilum]|uniref:AT hook domain-containing protein n=1 Tax=Colletotrichum orchidophilum TaxID=1209926 RepID=A0A1G4BFM4_9PEZI|nr:uncharacterized protein CORC01_04573 [Colletotrichum orchidophilum]OHF00165.1 hypothetical protein CORC01_04573 [Colletotrichum orchidophilum]